MKRIPTKRRGPISNRLSPTDLMRLAVCGSVSLGIAHNASADTLITFGGFTSDNTRLDSIIGYGDNVSASSADYTVSLGLGGVVGTPDITLDWLGNEWDSYTSWNGRGNVAQADFNGGVNLSILFTPSASTAVRLVSYDLDEWAGGGAGSINWTVSGPMSGTLAAGTWTMTDAGGRTQVKSPVTGLPGESLSLNLMLTGGAPSYFALDNLTFDQVAVPEPSTLALGALGAAALGAAAMRRRRRA
jgi:hypothetical protein